MLLVRKLHREFPRRVVEWGVSYILITWGFIILLNPGEFDYTIGGCALSIGLLRLTALYVNGAHVRSPIARTMGGFLSMLLWLFVVTGLIRTGGPVTTAFAIYPWLMMADAYAVYTAGGDAYQSHFQHQEKRLGYARG